MVIKTVQMRIPILISRSGFTAWGVDLARQANLTDRPGQGQALHCAAGESASSTPTRTTFPTRSRRMARASLEDDAA